jgi:hypothetical protein
MRLQFRAAPGNARGRARYRFDTPRRLQFCNRFGETGGTRTRGV